VNKRGKAVISAQDWPA